jgi:hypothetical protein
VFVVIVTQLVTRCWECRDVQVSIPTVASLTPVDMSSGPELASSLPHILRELGPVLLVQRIVSLVPVEGRSCRS